MTNDTLTKKLTGKVALATAKRLARDGAAVAITYIGAQQKANEVVGAIKTRVDGLWPFAPTAPTPGR